MEAATCEMPLRVDSMPLSWMCDGSATEGRRIWGERKGAVIYRLTSEGPVYVLTYYGDPKGVYVVHQRLKLDDVYGARCACLAVAEQNEAEQFNGAQVDPREMARAEGAL